MKNKYVFFGEENSVNLEIICKSFYKLKKKIRYIIVGNINLIENDLYKYKPILKINEINDPYRFDSIDSNKLNVFNVIKNKYKIENLLAQIQISNDLSNNTRFDLITMPINKYLFKKKINFNGMTEYLGEINKRKTLMLMKGEKFSTMPITTHISLKNLSSKYDEYLRDFFLIFNELSNEIKINFFKNFIFLCPNPHCGEKGLIGKEDLILKKYIAKLSTKCNKFLLPADSAYNNIKKHSLFISTYHDQALIPFKILNKKSFNQTIGLNYRRLSPSHGTAFDIKYKNLADNTSYLQCMLD